MRTLMEDRSAQDVPRRIKGPVRVQTTTFLLYLVNAIARIVSVTQSKKVSEAGTSKTKKQVTLLYEDDHSYDYVFKVLGEAIDEVVS